MRNNGRTTDYACKKNGKVTKTSVWRANNKKWVKKKTDSYLTGSITVFLSLMLAFVLAAVFSLLEGARVWGLEKRVSTDAVQTGHSLMAEYTPSLWKDYHVLFLDGRYEKDVFSIANVEDRGMLFSVENLDVFSGITGEVQAETWNLFGIHPQTLELETYELATDHGGQSFRMQAAASVKAEVGMDLLKSIYKYLTKSDEGPKVTTPAVVEETEQRPEIAENPVDTIARIRENGLLGVVYRNQAVSEKKMDLSQTIGKRELREGTWQREEASEDWATQILFLEYLVKNFSDCRGRTDGNTLDYELEYLVAGKGSDRENLQSVINQLTLMREVVNFVYLQSDQEKQELALAVATVIGTATLSPEMIPALKQGILAAWAYAESLSDVRLLLDGQKVSLMKTQDQWHTDLLHLESSISGTEKQEEGLDYEQYLRILMWKTRETVLTQRAMDLIEAKEQIRMDEQITAFQGKMNYTGEPLFSTFVTIGKGHPGTYIFQKEVQGDYLEDIR